MMTELIKYHNDSLDIFKQLHIDESRFITCCLIRNNQGIAFNNEKYYPVDVSRYAGIRKIPMSRALAELEVICKKHKDFELRMELADGSVLCTSLIYEYIVNEEDNILLVNWNPKFIPMVSGKMVKGEFIQAVADMDRISSSNRYALYLLLRKYLYLLDNQGLFTISKAEIRNCLGLTPDKYKEFNVLNSKIVKPTLIDMHDRLGVALQSKIVKDNIEFTLRELI